MAALQCEICGGKLMGKPGGIFECDSCGMEYSTEWAKAKIQEIKGTVKVEGTVQVQGSVTVEGSANKDSLMKRGLLALEDGNWDSAKEYFNKVLDIDPECAEAYLGLECCRRRFKNKEQIAAYDCRRNLSENFEKAKRFASGELAGLLEEYEASVNANEVAKKKKEASEKEEAALRLAPLRERIRPARNLIAAGDDFVLGVKTDGTVLAAGNDTYRVSTAQQYVFETKPGKINVSGWCDIVAVAAGANHSVGLKEDGTVVATGRNEESQCEISSWKNIQEIAAGGNFTVGLQKDGHVIFSGGDSEDGKNVPRNSILLDTRIWHDVVRIFAIGSSINGIREDGTLLSLAYYSDGKQENVEIPSRPVVEVYGRCDYLYAYGECHRDPTRGPKRILSCFEQYGSRFFCIYEDGTCNCGNHDLDYMKMNQWTNLVSIAVGRYFCVGLKEDGTLVTVRDRFHKMKDHGQCNLDHWRLFNSIDTLEEERQEFHRKKVKRMEAERIAVEEKKRKENERGEIIDSMLRQVKELRNRRNNLGIFALKEKKEIDRQIKELDEKFRRL